MLPYWEISSSTEASFEIIDISSLLEGGGESISLVSIDLRGSGVTPPRVPYCGDFVGWPKCSIGDLIRISMLGDGDLVSA